MSGFKVLRIHPIRQLGTTHEYIQEVECPRCGFKIAQYVKESCFNSDIEPDTCSQCNYPYSTTKVLDPKEPIRNEDINPSKR
jgi:C4-type Zn-finger protein